MNYGRSEPSLSTSEPVGGFLSIRKINLDIDRMELSPVQRFYHHQVTSDLKDYSTDES